jgi:thiamine-phosphate pyrophosphorylase
VAQKRVVACFLEDVQGAGRYDGTHLRDSADFAAARASAGMVGVAADSRHAALEAAEAGADYVALKDAELVAWWAELMEIPCTAEGAQTVDEAVALARLGADFVSVEAIVWTHRDGPKAAIAVLNAAIAAAGPG